VCSAYAEPVDQVSNHSAARQASPPARSRTPVSPNPFAVLADVTNRQRSPTKLRANLAKPCTPRSPVSQAAESAQSGGRSYAAAVRQPSLKGKGLFMARSRAAIIPPLIGRSNLPTRMAHTSVKLPTDLADWVQRQPSDLQVALVCSANLHAITEMIAQDQYRNPCTTQDFNRLLGGTAYEGTQVCQTIGDAIIHRDGG
jgi:hypothetical protein